MNEYVVVFSYPVGNGTEIRMPALPKVEALELAGAIRKAYPDALIEIANKGMRTCFPKVAHA